jgi:hypothetical protein
MKRAGALSMLLVAGCTGPPRRWLSGRSPRNYPFVAKVSYSCKGDPQWPGDAFVDADNANAQAR